MDSDRISKNEKISNKIDKILWDCIRKVEFMGGYFEAMSKKSDDVKICLYEGGKSICTETVTELFKIFDLKGDLEKSKGNDGSMI